MATLVTVSAKDVITTDSQLPLVSCLLVQIRGVLSANPDDRITAFNGGHASGDKARDLLSARWGASTFVQVTAYPNQRYENRWIGRHGPTTWPPRSPYLTPLDFFWDLMKEMTYRTKVHTSEKFLHWIMDAAIYIREHSEMIQRAVNSCCNEQALKTVEVILNSYETYLIKCGINSSH
jgi:hypothetical protein